jgi:hypothetical protein
MQLIPEALRQLLLGHASAYRDYPEHIFKFILAGRASADMFFKGLPFIDVQFIIRICTDIFYLHLHSLSSPSLPSYY